MAERSEMLDRSRVRAGDVLIALPSSGLHSNGFSLVRKVFDVERRDLSAAVPELGTSLGDTLLTPTRIYARPVAALLQEVPVRSLAHITGGGFHENIPRSLPDGLSARIDRKALRVPPIFGLLQREGRLDEDAMFRIFNMGVGMTAAVAPEDADAAVRVLHRNGVEAYPIGTVVPGTEGVVLC